MGGKQRARVVVSGRVQGVFFRMKTKQFADGIGVSGWVRNKKDGTVEAVFEGDDYLVEKAVEWCRQGPPLSKVEHLDVVWEAYTNTFTSFDIVY